MTSKVSDQIALFLQAKGIRHVFGIIGSGNAHIFDSITNLGFTEIVCVHHEQAAVMAMIAYFRITGHMSATLLTTGAGSANGVTGVVSAWMDSIPGLIISGNENSKFTSTKNPLRIWGIQGYASSEMAAGVTKYAARLTAPSKINFELEKCYATSLAGRPGPVWLDVPMNIQGSLVDPAQLEIFSEPIVEACIADYENLVTDAKTATKAVWDSLTKAERPVLWLGHGIRLAGAENLVLKLVEKLGVPVLVSWAGIDLIDSNHPLVFGRAGIYGQRAANFVLQNSDLVVAIGTRLAIPQVGYDLTEFARAAKVIVVDIDPTEASKHGSRIDTSICLDAKVFIEELFLTAPKSPIEPKQKWISQCNDYRTKYPWVDRHHVGKDGFINSYEFMDKLNRHLKESQIIVTDMGTALLSGHQVLKIKAGQRLLTSTGLGEMGFGLPAAVGASFARNKGEVMCLNCDGGMMLNLQELQTIAHHHLPIKIFIFNNDGYLMIKHTQKALFSGRYSGTDVKSGVSCPDYKALATAFKFPYFSIRTWADFDETIPLVQEQNGPVFCEVFMHPEQPLVPKLGVSNKGNGVIVSPPLEDLSPFLPREEMRAAMIIGLHAKSEQIV